MPSSARHGGQHRPDGDHRLRGHSRERPLPAGPDHLPWRRARGASLSCASTSGIWSRPRTCWTSTGGRYPHPCGERPDRPGAGGAPGHAGGEALPPSPATPVWGSPASSTPWTPPLPWPQGRSAKAGPGAAHHPPRGVLPGGGGPHRRPPGFSAFDAEKGGGEPLDKDTLAETFREFRPYLGQCRFVGCAHVKEAGCAVLEAVKAGKIPPAATAATFGCTTWPRPTSPGESLDPAQTHHPSPPGIDWERTGVFHARKGGERNENGGDPCPQGAGGPAAKTFPYLRHTGQSRDIGWDRYFPDTRKDWLP